MADRTGDDTNENWNPPYSYERTHSTAQVHGQWDSIEDGDETGQQVSVAGRLMLRREQGKICFGKLVDSSGDIQLFASANHTQNFDQFVGLNLGDWIGAEGEVIKTKRGELSVRVKSFVLLAKARRNFGDKWLGITDTDLRYRQRYADLWANEGSREVFLKRSKIVSFIRRWMEERGFVEVETPVLVPVHGGADARPFNTHHNALDMELTLRIAQELYLKRLVVGGIEKVFEIGRVFRNEGISTRHNPEFTMMEAQWAYADYLQMMELFESLVSDVATAICGTSKITYQGREIDLTPPWRRASMIELINETTGENFSISTPIEDLRQFCKEREIPTEEKWGPGKLLLEIYEKTTEPSLWGPVFVKDHPREISPLARPHRDNDQLVERFEPIVAGRELGNNFTELIDPDEQRATLEEQARAAAAGDEEAMHLDEDYLRALEYGLPPNAGFGMGVDRLVMLLTDRQSIRDVVFFPTLRPESPE